MSGADPGDGNHEGPRMPKDMKGLLRLCAEASNSEQPNETVNFAPMEPEVRSKTVVLDGFE